MMLGTFNLVPVMRKGSANKSTPARSAVWKWRGSQHGVAHVPRHLCGTYREL